MGRGRCTSEALPAHLPFSFSSPQQALLLLINELVHIQVVVVSFGLHQLGVSSFFLNLTVPNHQNAVGGADRGEPVGDDKAGPALKHSLNGFDEELRSVSTDEVASSSTKMRVR